MAQKENIIGAIVLTLIIGLIAFLVLRPQDKGGDANLESQEATQAEVLNSILRPELLPAISQTDEGTLTVSQGKGSVEGGSWRYKNSWPNPDQSIVNAEGETVKLKVTGIGAGGVIWLQAGDRLNPQSAGQLARQALNDPGLQILKVGNKLYYQGEKIVANRVRLRGNRLTIDGLYTAQVCKTQVNQPAVAASCRAKLRPGK